MLTPMDPIAIREKGDVRRMLSTVEGAARCLAIGWSGDRTLPSYFAACRAGLAALEGRGTAAQVRAAIVRAAMDTGILA